jgi:hypothetical protein
MCVQYWPAAKNREEIYGGVGVTVEVEEQLANFMIRTIRWGRLLGKRVSCNHKHREGQSHQ